MQLALVKQALSDQVGGKKFELFEVINGLIKIIYNKKYSVLEIGCSSGYHNEVFKIAGLDLEYEGCDYSKEFIKLAKKMYPKIKFKICDARKLTYGNKSFDIALLDGVLLHIKNWKNALSEACRVSKKYLLIHRQPILHSNKTIYLLKKGYGIKMFEVQINEEELVNELRKNAFAVIAVKSYDPTLVKGLKEPAYIKSYLTERVTTKLSPNPK